MTCICIVLGPGAVSVSCLKWSKSRLLVNDNLGYWPVLLAQVICTMLILNINALDFCCATLESISELAEVHVRIVAS